MNKPKAFPNPNRDKHPDVTKDSEGMDLRDYFAASASEEDVKSFFDYAESILEEAVGLEYTAGEVRCKARYLYADQMMEERNGT